MTTSFTAHIEKGCTFNEFVWECAKGMEALYCSSVEERLQKPKEDSFSKQMVERYQKELNELWSLIGDDWEVRAAGQHEKALQQYRKSLIAYNKMRSKYDAMRLQVEAWIPPTEDHAGLKAFMLQQIDSSIEWMHKPEEPKKRSGKELRDIEIKEATRSLEHYQNNCKEELLRGKRAGDWIKALIASVPLPKEPVVGLQR